MALSSCCAWGRAHAVAVDSSLRVRAMRQEGLAGMVRVRVEERTRHYALQRHPHRLGRLVHVLGKKNSLCWAAFHCLGIPPTVRRR